PTICKSQGILDFCIPGNSYNEENIKQIMKDYKSILKVDITYENEIKLYNILVKQLKKNDNKKIYLEKIWDYLVRRKIEINDDIDLMEIANLGFEV
ncbi:10213_t:CDS:1, partial [Funneliformis caledonium]